MKKARTILILALYSWIILEAFVRIQSLNASDQEKVLYCVIVAGISLVILGYIIVKKVA